ncbi:MAG: type II secretion system protein E [Chloroflexi bacterium RBG_13_50_21]|nr:MAG: type II secretion system protein E [Chloroflexi bacterium RBG_13_50_21]
MDQPIEPTKYSSQDPNMIKLKAYLINTVAREFNQVAGSPSERDAIVKEKLSNVYEQTGLKLPESVRMQLFHDILDEMIGFGPIQYLLEDTDVTEVMVNRHNQVYVERSGKLLDTDVKFENDEHVMRIIERIIAPLGRRVDAESPMVDARLPDGSRVNAVIPPVAIDGPLLTIRKFSKSKYTIDQLIEFESLTRMMADFLRACVMGRLNTIISGGTGSGKTTLLNVLSSLIPETERVVTIEDSAELRLHQDHVVRMEARPPDIDGRGQVTIRDMVRNCLRMRPDRIIVGECRGGEALDMLQAMNTGHDGSLTTLHANSPRDALSRLETMVLMAGMELPLKVIRQQIASAVDLVVHQSRLKNGPRKVTAISEVAGMEGDTIVMTDIFKFEQTGISPTGEILGQFKPTGIRPMFSPRLEAVGYRLSAELFSPENTTPQPSGRRK